MHSPRVFPILGLLLSATLSPALLHAQAAPAGADLSPAAAFSKARALYYTPSDQGLQGFHCEVSFDWKTFLQKATNQPVPDNDPRLQYLRTIQLTVDDTLRGTGELHWTAPAPPPDGTEDSVNKMRSGFQQIWSGFFQSWNGFFTGDMVTLDSKATVEHTPAGFHVAVRNGPGLAEEQYDNNLLLQKVHVGTPTLDSTVLPSFTPTPQGLLVTSFRSTYRQQDAAAAVDVLMNVRYAPVSSFQLPSEVTVSVGPASFDFHLANCTVQTKLSPK